MPQLDGRKPHILIIEDNPGDIELLRLALENAGLDCNLTVFADGGDALAFVQEREDDGDHSAPDLAIIDLNLPKNDGLEILEAMRLNPKLTDVFVAIFTSSSLPKEREKMQELRVGHYITKPSTLDEFMQIGMLVKEFLRRAASATHR